MKRKIPMINANYKVYVNGGLELLGLADVTLPSFESVSETITGSGIMGEVEVPVTGHFGAMTLTMNFRALYGDPLDFRAAHEYHFDLRAAMELEDPTSFERSVGAERWSITGQVKIINPGTRAAQSLNNAVIEVALRRAEHYMDGKKVMEFDILNDIYEVNGEDVYRDIRAAIS